MLTFFIFKTNITKNNIKNQAFIYMLEKFLDFIRRSNHIREFQYLQEDKAGLFLIIYLGVATVSYVLKFVEFYEAYKKIGFPIILGILVVGLILYSASVNSLLRNHRKELNSTRDVLTKWADNYNNILLKFKYLEVVHTYEIGEDGTGKCYRKFTIQPEDREIFLDIFSIGEVSRGDDLRPTLFGTKFKIDEIKADGKRVKMSYVEIESEYKNKIRIAAFFQPVLNPSEPPLNYEISYVWRGMWKNFIKDVESDGDIETTQDTERRVMKFIAPKGYEFQTIRVVSTKPSTPIQQSCDEPTYVDGKHQIVWTIKNPPKGSIKYKIIGRKIQFGN